MMNHKSISIWLVLLAMLAGTSLGQEPAPATGSLFLVGGGGTPKSVMKNMIELVEGGLILVVPYASRKENEGDQLKSFFEEHGASDVAVLDLDNEDLGLQQISTAKLIWFGGGSQNRLLERLPKEFISAIQMHYREGGHLGGTSAGAAIMSERMLTGESDLEAIRAGRTEITQGLSITDHIVDQHFHRRRRFNRLLAAVLDHPQSLGLGIDEKTAAVIVGNQMTVLGESSVMVIDATQTTMADSEPDENRSVVGVEISLLVDGETFDLSGNR